MPNDEVPTVVLDRPAAVPTAGRGTRPTAAGVPTRGPALVLLGAIAASFLWPVPLLTAPDDGMVGCFTSGTHGVLLADATYGTTLIEHDAAVPVMWPHGFTGRHSGFQVEVVDTSGHVVARTGTRVQIDGGYTGENPRAFLACGSVVSQ
jgi:hypothetical protein